MNRHLVIALTFLAACTASASAGAESLAEVYRLAIERDATFQAANATYRADVEVLAQARAALLPLVGATAGRTRNDVTLKAPDVQFVVQGSNDWYTNDWQIALSQPLFDYPAFATYRKAKHAVALADNQLQSAVESLILRTARAYIGVLAATDNLDLAVSERVANERQLELARARLEVGLGTITDRHEAEARFKSAQAAEISAKNTLEDARQGVVELIGELPQSFKRLRPDAELRAQGSDNIDEWTRKALESNVALRALVEAVEIARAEVNVQRGGHYPKLDLVASESNSDADGSLSGPGSERDSTTIALQLSVPIFQGGYVNSKTTAARERLKAAQSNLEAQRRTTVRDTRAAFLTLTSQTSKIDALAQAVTANESALEGKQKGFEAGLNSNIEVLDAQRDLFRAKRDYYQSRYDFLVGLFRLEQATATLSEASLTRVDQWLE